MQPLFWISLLLLFYTYIGYGLLLLLVNSFIRKKKISDDNNLPDLTLIVPAYNEEKIIRNKIDNSLQLLYPEGKLFFVFVTDGSTDNTANIVAGYSQIKLLHQEERGGKAAALNRAMKEVCSPITVFTDANSMLHPGSIRNLVRHFQDRKIGGVSGEKRIADDRHSAVGFGEKLYWQYESMMKDANAQFYTLVGAVGELFAIRTLLFTPLEENIILDDFAISAQVCQKGYRFFYEKEAVAVESSSATMAEEQKRKMRISAGCFQALFSLTDLLNPFRMPLVSFQYISHRVLRWIACPIALPLLALSSAILFSRQSNFLYDLLFWGQLAFYFVALLGWLLSEKYIGKFLLIPFYAVFMIYSQYRGFYRFVTKKQTVFWEKAARK